MGLKVTEKLFQNNHLNVIYACSTENNNEVQ